MLIFTAATANLLVCITWLMIIMLRTRATLEDIGIQFTQLISDVKLGVFAFIILCVPVFSTQAFFTMFYESEHPLLQTLEENPQLDLFFYACFAAVIAAPIAEEFAFRVILQGWLEKVAEFFSDRESWGAWWCTRYDCHSC